MKAQSATGRTTQRSEQAAETRRRLLDAAVEAFSERDFDDVAAADIARSVGVAYGLVYHYFGSKRGVYVEALRAAADQMSANFTARPGVPPGRQVRDALKSHFEYLSAHRGFALRLVLAGSSVDPEAWEVFEARRRHSVQWLLQLLDINPDGEAMRMMGRAMAGAFDATAVHWLESEQPFDVDSVVDSLTHIALAAIRAASELDPTIDCDAAESILWSNETSA
ncbi:TetR/AcrR family transcriptional regulator [Mycobacterium sp. Root135]|uniref:TetR/AcrR family transcriptional regulator n=1 Tax=Mycobacterium sp. Root135 TaxID=1736457 RepID=UPI0009E7E596|nr:TetR/AcrR family transcriptional regulator [Mycobacterium sp. Root135]